MQSCECSSVANHYTSTRGRFLKAPWSLVPSHLILFCKNYKPRKSSPESLKYTPYLCILYIYIVCASCRVWLSFHARPTISTTSCEAQLPKLQWARKNFPRNPGGDAPWGELFSTFLNLGSSAFPCNVCAARAPPAPLFLLTRIHFFHHSLFLLKTKTIFIFVFSQMNLKKPTFNAIFQLCHTPLILLLKIYFFIKIYPNFHTTHTILQPVCYIKSKVTICNIAQELQFISLCI